MRNLISIVAASLFGTVAAMGQMPAKPKAPTSALSIAMPQDPSSVVTSAKGPVPEREKEYLALIDQARKRYVAARSVDARRNTRLDMQIAVHDFMGLSHNAQDWIGIFKDSKKTPGGAVTLTVEIAPGVIVRTWDNAALDTSYNSLLRPFMPVGKLAAILQIGDTVMFSANLIGGVISTDDDMILRPQLIAQFQKLQKLDDDGRPLQ